jgi:hypothetical protein
MENQLVETIKEVFVKMADFNLNISANVQETNNIAGETLVPGDLVYLSNDGKYYKTSASLTSKSTTEIRLVTVGGVINDSVTLLTYGYYDYGSPVLTAGDKYFVGTAIGDITDQLYIGTNNIIRYIGTAYSTSIILFNPDQTYISENATKINGVPFNFAHSHTEADIVGLDKYTQAEVDALIASATDNYYVHTQVSSSASWVIAHSMGKKPSVSIQDGSGNDVEGAITYTDDNNLTITFNTAFTGVAYLN